MQFSWRVGILYFALVTWFGGALAIPAEKDTSTTAEATSHAPSASPTTQSPSFSSGTNAQETRTKGRRPGLDGSDDATQTGLTDRRSSTAHSSTSPTPSLIIPPTGHHTHSHLSWSVSPGAPLTHHFPPPGGMPPSRAPPPSRSGQPPIAIAFEVLGGIVALIILLALGRCYIVWRRTPPRDRIAALMNRHQLEREMEEMERERLERLNQALEARRWRPPPPPYQPAPDYEAVVRSEPAG